MAVQRQMAAVALAVAALAGCAELTAEAPLFSPADQIGPPPLTEGIWIAIGDGCAETNARRSGRFPKECVPFEINRAVDGAWQATIRDDLISNLSREEREHADDPANGPYRLILAPAVERSTQDEYAPLYVAELSLASDQNTVSGYALISPAGEMPAVTFFMSASIGCDDILREGPIEGVSPEYRIRIDEAGAEHRELSGCVASTQAAVRESARRAAIENIGDLVTQRYVYARPR